MMILGVCQAANMKLGRFCKVENIPTWWFYIPDGCLYLLNKMNWTWSEWVESVYLLSMTCGFFMQAVGYDNHVDDKSEIHQGTMFDYVYGLNPLAFLSLHI